LERSDGIIISISGFSLQVYKVNFCKSERLILLLQTWNIYETRTYSWQI